MFMKTVLLIHFFAFCSLAFAHGEDKPGPHGGYIRMPGNFHTEVLQDKRNLKVYLLDAEWKNPSVSNSSVKMTVNGKPLECRAEGNLFICPLLPNTDLKRKGKLVLEAKREGSVGNPVTYALPLKLEHH